MKTISRKLSLLFLVCAMAVPAGATEQSDLLDAILAGRKRTNSGLDDAKVKPGDATKPEEKEPARKADPVKPATAAPVGEHKPYVKPDLDAGNANAMNCTWLEQLGKKPSHIYFEAWLHTSCPYAINAAVEECEGSGKSLECKEVPYSLSGPGKVKTSSRKRGPVLKSAVPQPPKPKR